MEIRIGLVNTARELSFSTKQTPEEVQRTVTDAVRDSSPFLSFTDDKGATHLAVTAHLAYVELGSADAPRIGFVR
ncbi:DUF3107 domain-containing protein [Clavibacter sp. VKM Ac-2872]|uniref:DUF3107 domain-containing protein n=1 Tax=Clavibacter sp. VKM Ac-2872 TaxID=2783812 RepID=UPI00188A1312|nr:DUF3107 domain-containing protein [Clavibacter sp. VKM Ac-2872]